jgi:hypothetical protein
MGGPEETVSLAFFRASHYLVEPKTGGILTLSGQSAAERKRAPHGFQRVTRDELFERWPEWRQVYEGLLGKFVETGSA